ncbi:DNA polymerase-3 subunit delta' [Austwickia chelonae]|uniref:DNA polymerase III delta' subunit n=1 Tax=Austwickia chelonae NBRC 105200 TaxID=1184607 RepID=K6VJZ1_9MICO|nr:DNA polymerase III subunit delta' [Austwickia chelonae]GAB77009.1 DNA polymerase III delta' subunit [Austwickia chelonae NBRC 105200]SEW33255.1 DNA polymerase-3 subunit delta' [Austwickia chelonae]
MTVWDDLVGQGHVIDTLTQAATDPAAMTHAWLITGPPGSGVTTAARAFAAALECPHHGCGTCRDCRTAVDGTHADVEILTTEGLSIRVEQARALAATAALRPSVGPWRVLVVEDADRLTERAADALLKALEEPAARTVWVLCAPSPQDVIVTIRSRSRHLRLRTPPIDGVAELVRRRHGVDAELALAAARASHGHIDAACRFALDEDARERRRQIIRLTGRIHSVPDAVAAAAEIIAVTAEETGSTATDRNAQERTRLMETLGVDPSARTQPPHVRAQLAALEKEQKARATRHSRDVVDRALVDLLSVYRDVLTEHFGQAVPLMNEDFRPEIEYLAGALTPEGALVAVDAVGQARERITANVPPLLALEAMAISLQTPDGR